MVFTPWLRTTLCETRMRYKIYLAVSLALLVHAGSSAAGPVETYAVNANSSPFRELSFRDPPGNTVEFSSTPIAFLIVGDIEKALDSGLVPDAMIVSTNTALDLNAPYPATQTSLVINRLSNEQRRFVDRQVAKRWEEAASKGRNPDTALAILTEPFAFTFSPIGAPVQSGAKRLPANICMLATDYPSGGSNKWGQDLVGQDNIAEGVAACLNELELLGSHSVFLPLVDSASHNSGLTRRRQFCRLFNSVAGIAQGIAQFRSSRTPEATHNLTEIGVVVWDEALKPLFGASPDPTVGGVGTFSDLVSRSRGAFRDGLQDPDFQLNQCLSDNKTL